MAFTKGDSRINRKGRPKGSKDRLNEEMRDKIRDFVNDNWQLLKDNFSGTDYKEQWRAINAFIKLYLPPPFDPRDLTIDQMEQVIEYWENKNKTDEQEKSIDAED